MMRWPHPHVTWLFGLSGAGKSTLASMLAEQQRKDGIPVLQLDGDDMRAGVSKGLGFTPEARNENIRRAVEVAKLAVKSGISVVASFITPKYVQRKMVKDGINRYVTLIYLDTPIEVCAERDVKGLYAKEKAGAIKGMAADFEAPVLEDITVHPDLETPEECIASITEYFSEKGT